ncbi:MAG TPA: GNAT family N-acetyltransferase [Pyrinomonadaceae bacterium]|nr:GNAT family N-acetyltransferase [Pyrinomonadaceae bacterium]
MAKQAKVKEEKSVLVNGALLSIRRGVLQDAGLLSELGSHTFFETFAADNTHENMAAYLSRSFSPEQQAAELADPSCLFQIAELNGVPVGYSLLRSHDELPNIRAKNPIELVRLYVSRESLGSGVGAALMQAAINEARQEGYETLWLGVWEHNHRARAFYRKWNFQEVGTHLFQLGGDRQTDILMLRSLSEEPH